MIKVNLIKNTCDLVVVYYGVVLVISLLLIFSNYLISKFFIIYKEKAKQNFGKALEKSDAYECGFAGFALAWGTLFVGFYVIAILFLLFDLEILYLLPWVVVAQTLSWVSFWSVIFFVFLLTLGLAYEWAKGGLSWAPHTS